jgi:hypothetical protein
VEVDEIEQIISKRKKLSDEEISQLYLKVPNVWVLLEPVRYGNDNRAKELIVLEYNKEKDVLRDFVMNMDDWDNASSLIYFYTGDDGTCTI